MLTDPVETKISDRVVDKQLLSREEVAYEQFMCLGNHYSADSYGEWDYQGSRLTTQTNNGQRYAY